MSDDPEHISEETLELYSLGALPEQEQGPVEEHLLICTSCQDRLVETDQYVQAVREAATEYRRRHPRRSRGTVGARFDQRTFLRLKPAFITAAVLLTALVAWRAQFQNRSKDIEPAPVAVVLQTLRSVDSATAPAGTPLRLILNVEGLPALPLWRVEVVGADGGQAGSFTGRAKDERVEILILRGLTAGQYWIRAAAPDSPGDTLREFGLVVR